MRNLSRIVPAGLVFAAHGAAGMELDGLLPAGTPGFGAAPPVSIFNRPPVFPPPVAMALGGFSLRPELEAGFGYDSAPDGQAGGAPLFTLRPHVTAVDEDFGFGAYLAGTIIRFPTLPAQDVSAYTVALGQGVVLPAETIAFGIASLRGEETGFSLARFDPRRPIAYTVNGVTASDRITAGIFTFTPKISVSRAAFSDFPDQDVTDTREEVLADVSPGGPAHVVVRLHAGQERYRAASFDTDHYTALAGIADDATGLWDFRLLAGAAASLPAAGKSRLAPVLEAAADWMPDELDSISFSLAREIDDPEQLSPTGYTLTEADVSIAHEYLRDVDLTAGARVRHADYFAHGEAEDVFTANAGVIWHVNGALALTAGYDFNDRQANFTRAANEHVFTLTAAWTL